MAPEIRQKRDRKSAMTHRRTQAIVMAKIDVMTGRQSVKHAIHRDSTT